MNTQKFKIEDVVYFVAYDTAGEMEFKSGKILGLGFDSARLEVEDFPRVWVRDYTELYNSPEALRERMEQDIKEDYNDKMKQLGDAFNNSKSHDKN